MIKDRRDLFQALAAHNDTAPQVLKVLSRSPDCSTRYWLTFNPRTPIAVLRQLAQDANELVRHCAILRLQTLGRR